MNTESDRPTDLGMLDDATKALRSTSIPTGPSKDLIECTLRGMEERTVSLTKDKIDPRQQRRRMLGYLGFGSLSVVAIALIAFLASTMGQGTAVAFDEAIQKVAAIETVSFRVHTTFNGGPPKTTEVIVSGNKVRVDNVLGPGTAWIIDRDAKGALITSARSRLYQTVDMSQGGILPTETLGTNIREQLLELKDAKASLASTDDINGLKADKYVVNGGKAFYMEGNWTVWVSRETGLPMKVSIETKSQMGVTSWLYESFDWNPKPDPATFSIDPPAGSKEATILGVFPPLPPRKLKTE